MNKYIFFVISLLFSIQLVFSEVIISFPYGKNQKTVTLLDKKEIILDRPFNALKELEISQQYRITFNSIEKSRLLSLSFVGDEISFNNILLKYVDFKKYYIEDKTEGFKIFFKIGEIDSIEVLSILNFSEKEITIFDKISTVIVVKDLFQKLDIKPEENKVPEAVLGNTIVEKANSYQKFVDQLSMLNKNEVLDNLKRYIRLNFKLSLDYKVESGFMSPYELFYKKEGGYKSFAYFYYYTLKQLLAKDRYKFNFNLKSYFVTDLKKRDAKEIFRIENLSQGEREKIEREYRLVKPSYNLEELINYLPPDFSRATYIVALEDKNKWLYTTGDEWINVDVYKPERVCSSYMRKGCYYALINNDEMHIGSQNEDDIIWEVFFDMK
jgi:hypothetical protein